MFWLKKQRVLCKAKNDAVSSSAHSEAGRIERFSEQRRTELRQRRKKPANDHRRRREDGGGGPRLGRHQRTDAPRRRSLGPPVAVREILIASIESPRKASRFDQELAESATDLAVFGPVPRQHLCFRHLLRHPKPHANLPHRPRHKCDYFRRHRRFRSHPRRRDPSRARPCGNCAHRSRCLALHHVI